MPKEDIPFEAFLEANPDNIIVDRDPTGYVRTIETGLGAVSITDSKVEIVRPSSSSPEHHNA